MGVFSYIVFFSVVFFFFFKQKTAYEMRISDWSSDVCSSDLAVGRDADDFDGRSRKGDLAGGFESVDGFHVDIHEHDVGKEFSSLGNRFGAIYKIGRASCRERVCQYV